MSQGEAGFDVTIYAWVSCARTSKTLMHLLYHTYTVHPPAWSMDDPIVLHMQLEHLAKMQCLVEFRKDLNIVPKYSHLKDISDYVIRASVSGWVAPADYHGVRHEVKFYPLAEYL